MTIVKNDGAVINTAQIEFTNGGLGIVYAIDAIDAGYVRIEDIKEIHSRPVIPVNCMLANADILNGMENIVRAYSNNEITYNEYCKCNEAITVINNILTK